jgi:hypothetical protein
MFLKEKATGELKTRAVAGGEFNVFKLVLLSVLVNCRNGETITILHFYARETKSTYVGSCSPTVLLFRPLDLPQYPP